MVILSLLQEQSAWKEQAKNMRQLSFRQYRIFISQNALVEAARKSEEFPYHKGVVECRDSFYGQHAPQTKPVGYELLNKWNAWVQCGCLASEMESAALFVVASYRKVRIGTVLLTMANQERAKKGLDNPVVHDTEAPIRTAVEALRILIRKERR